MTDTLTELRLTGTAVQTLADNAHLPGWPNAVSPDRVSSDTADSDADLNRAAARWFQGATSRRAGAGRVYIGTAPVAEALDIIDYLQGVADALTAPGVDDLGARAEGRAIQRACDAARKHMSQSASS